MAAKDELGRRGERIAEEHLRASGATVLERNWRCPSGELDLVVRDGSDLVVVEVKTRSGTGWGTPLEAITPAKLARLRLLAGEWRAAHPELRGSLRLDAIGVLLPPGGAPSLEHVRAVGR